MSARVSRIRGNIMTSTTLLERKVLTSHAEGRFAPIGICEIEIGRPLPDISTLNQKTSQQYQAAQCLIRLHTQPLGLLELPLEASRANAEVYAKQIWQALGEQINAHLREDGLSEVTTLAACGLPVLQRSEEHTSELQSHVN